MSSFELKPNNEILIVIILSVLLIGVTILAVMSTVNGVKASIPGKEDPALIVENPDREFGEIFEENGMICAEFVARSYDMRKAMGITCLTNGNFLTIAPVVMHPENQQELVGVQAKIRRHAIVNGGW